MTNEINDYKKGACLCQKCKKVFHQNEIEHNTYKEELGQQQVIDRIDNVCPYCGSTNFGLIDYPVSEEELIFKNGKFYPNHNRKLKLHMDQVTEEILERDRRLLKGQKAWKKFYQEFYMEYK